MKIRLLNYGGYKGLLLCRFPLEIGGDIDMWPDGSCEVKYHVMQSIDGFCYYDRDAPQGGSYLFNPDEFELIK